MKQTDFSIIQAKILHSNWAQHISIVITMCILVAVTAQLYQGSNLLRIASIYGDDSYIMHTLVLAHKKIFINDINALTLADANKYTLLVAVSSFLYLVFDISPQSLFPTFVIAQSVLLALGVYYYSYVITKSKSVSVLLSLFVLCTRPYAWNIAWFAWIQWYPYPGEFSLPFLLFAAALFLRRKLLFVAPLLLAGFTHPLQGSYLVAILSCTVLVSRYYKKSNDQTWPLTYLYCSISCGAVFITPTVLNVFTQHSIAEYADFFHVSLSNTHILTWLFDTQNFTISSIVYSSYLLLALLYAKDEANIRRKCLVKTLVFCGIAFTLIHYLSTLSLFSAVGFLRILILTRSSQIIILLTIPFIATFVGRRLMSEPLFIRSILTVIALNALLLPTPKNITILLIASAVLSLQIFAHRRTLLLFVTCLLLIPNYNFLLPSDWKWNFDTLFFSELRSSYIFYTVTVIVAFFYIIKKPKLASVILSVMIYCTSYTNSARVGRDFSGGNARSLYAVQEWGKTNTDPGTNFFVQSGISTWRSISERPRVELFPPISIAVYEFPESAKQFYIAQIKLVAKILNLPEKQILSSSNYNSIGRLKDSFDKEATLSFLKAYGCKYAVVNSKNLLFDFPVVFTAGNYSIQSIPQ